MKMSLKCFMFRSLKTLQVDLIFKIKVKALSRSYQAAGPRRANKNKKQGETDLSTKFRFYISGFEQEKIQSLHNSI